GLLLKKRWAEWLTVLVTASFVPFEVYEIAQRGGAAKIAALVLNVAIVAYLGWRVGARLSARRDDMVPAAAAHRRRHGWRRSTSSWSARAGSCWCGGAIRRSAGRCRAASSTRARGWRRRRAARRARRRAWTWS